MHEITMHKLAENRRLALLRVLGEDPDGSLNTSMIEDIFDVMKMGISRDVIHADGAWLASVGAIIVEQIGNITVFTLTKLGESHLQRKTIIPGIKRPSFR